MATVEERFYVTGGTLPLDADSYVVRKADTDLLIGLRAGAFCYVLNTRQMGKSSLMIRTARRLKEDGCLVAILDMTAIGLNLSVDQWYLGMLIRVGSQVGFEEELLDYWRRNKDIGPMQRFVEALRQVVLMSTAAPTLVVFVDEIDSVRSLSFSADEFFAGIRQCYNRRAEDPVFARLTFCLIGVATPADLIREARISPFNIGKRIELPDFTRNEAELLAVRLIGKAETAGIADSEAQNIARRLLDRIFHWTNGHPYMTQRLCRAVAEKIADFPRNVRELRSHQAEQVVDAGCSQLFLTKAALETDDNLTFVRNRLLKTDPAEADLASLLDLYLRVRSGRNVLDDETNPKCAILRLSGVVSAKRGFLQLRNRIYDRVFDRQWIAEHMPDAEIRRQRRAYRRGVMRAAIVGLVAFAIASTLAALAISRELKARQAMDYAHAAGKRATEQERIANARLSRMYVSSGVKLMDDGDFASSLTYFSEAMALDQNDPERMRQHGIRLESAIELAPRLERVWIADGPVRWAEYSPNKQLVLAADDTGRAHVWEVKSGAEMPIEMRHDGPIGFAAFSPDGNRVVTCGDDGCAQVWDLRTRKLAITLRHASLPGRILKIVYAAWSPDGRILATAAFGGISIWDVSSTLVKKIGSIDEPGAIMTKIAISPDGRHIAFVASNYLGWVADLPTGRETHPIGSRMLGRCYNGFDIGYSADGKLLAAAGGFGNMVDKQNRGAAIFDAATGATAIPFLSHGAGLGNCLAFSPDGTCIVTAGDDLTTRMWDVRTGHPLYSPVRTGARVRRVCFSSDGSRFLTASMDGSVGVWNAATGEKVCAPIRHAGDIVSAQFGTDSKHILTASEDGTVRIWATPLSEPPVVRFAHSAQDVRDRLLAESRIVIGTFSTARRRRQEGQEGQEGQKRQQTEACICDVRTGRRLFPSEAAAADWTDYSLSGDGCRIVLSQWDNHKLQVWDVQRGCPISAMFEGEAAALNRDGRLILIQGAGGETRLVDTETGQERMHCVSTAQLRQSPQYKVGRFSPFCPIGRYVALADPSGSVRLVNVESGKDVGRTMHHAAGVWQLGFSPSGRYLFTWNTGGFVQAWNVPDCSPACAPQQQHATNQFPQTWIYYCADGRYAITSGTSIDARSLLWRLDGSSTLSPMPFGTGMSNRIRFSPDGNSFVAVNQSSAIWDTTSLSIRVPALDHRARVNAVAFSPDSRRIASASDDGTARIWDARTGSPLTPPMVHGSAVTAVEFSPDGRNVVTGDTDGAVRVWDAATGEAITPFRSVHGAVEAVEFIKTGLQFLAASEDDTRIWELHENSRTMASISAVSQLLSGVRLDSQVGSVAVDRNRLRECWRDYNMR